MESASVKYFKYHQMVRQTQSWLCIIFTCMLRDTEKILAFNRQPIFVVKNKH